MKPPRKTTKRTNDPSIPTKIGLLLAWAVILFVLVRTFLQNLPSLDDLLSDAVFGVILYLAIVVFWLSTPLMYLIGSSRAKRRVRQETAAIQDANPYRYYKELPNAFGIGVTSLLFDSTLENEKDIVAALLDLCAQNYLHLSKHSDHYVIRLLPTPDKTPLSNEAYLLNLIRKNRLQHIDYQRWYDLCLADGINLGLYQPTQLPDPNKRPRKTSFSRTTKIFLTIAVIIGIIGVIFFSAFNPLFAGTSLPYSYLFAMIRIPFFLLIASPVIARLFTVIYDFLQIGKTYTAISYKNTLEKHLTKTEKGIAELQKLYAFKNFLAQFSTFVDKDPEAVILWDRYLSYAQVFGLADELMKSGYHQLIDNAAPFRLIILTTSLFPTLLSAKLTKILPTKPHRPTESTFARL